MQTFLFNEFNAQISTLTVYDILAKARWSRKLVKAWAAKRSQPLRTTWIGI